MKRKLLMALALIVAMTSFAGCQKKQTATDPNEKITIRWMGFPIDGVGTPNEVIEKYIEEKFDVNLEPIFITYGEYQDKKAMMLAGDDIPDIIYEFDPKNVVQDADQGFIAKIPYETIKKYAPDIYNVINETEPRAWSYSRVDGENFGIPNLAYANNYVKIGLWREDWLKNVGIDKIPETIEEMGDALYKFTYNDPDGNGQNDTYGMTGTISWNAMFQEIFGAYGAMPFSWIKTDDGKYAYGGLQQNTVDALTTITNWYKEGLIHPDFVTDSVSGTSKEKFANGKIGYINQLGGYYDETDKTAIQNLTKSMNPNAVVTDAHPVKGPRGESGGFIWGSAAHIVALGRHLEDDEVKLAKILEILNTMVSDEEVMKAVRLGEEGVTYKLAEGSNSIADGIEWIAPYDDSEVRKAAGIVNDFSSGQFFMPVSPSFEAYEKYTIKAKIEAYNKAANGAKGTTDAFLKPDLLPSASEYFTTLRNAQIKLMVDIITGTKSIDSYMTEFTKTWEQYGGKKLEEETIPMAEDIQAMLKEIGVE